MPPTTPLTAEDFADIPKGSLLEIVYRDGRTHYLRFGRMQGDVAFVHERRLIPSSGTLCDGYSGYNLLLDGIVEVNVFSPHTRITHGTRRPVYISY